MYTVTVSGKKKTNSTTKVYLN